MPKDEHRFHEASDLLEDDSSKTHCELLWNRSCHCCLHVIKLRLTSCLASRTWCICLCLILRSSDMPIAEPFIFCYVRNWPMNGKSIEILSEFDCRYIYIYTYISLSLFCLLVLSFRASLNAFSMYQFMMYFCHVWFLQAASTKDRCR